MATIKPKQITKLLASFIEIPDFVPSGSNFDDVSFDMNQAVNALSVDNSPLPLQVGSNIQPGVDTSAGFNYCKVYTASDDKILVDLQGNTIYGKIALTNAKWIITYYSTNVNNVESTKTMNPAVHLRIEIPYIYSFNDLPVRAFQPDISSITNSPVALQAGVGSNFSIQADQLTVISDNTLSHISKTFDNKLFLLLVNGVVYTPYEQNPCFTITNFNINWSVTNSGLPIKVGDSVLAVYSY